MSQVGRAEEVPSVFERRDLEDIYEEIRTVYIEDDRPWVLGYSGGKDSTTALQLTWKALQDLEEEKRDKPVFVISSDTLVETPVIVDYIDTSLARINKAADEQGLPIEAKKVEPTVEDSFFVNLIGKGYPAPSARFRWCTERLKIKPANRFILNRAEEYGEVVVILGVRKSESATRKQVMNLHEIEGSHLSRHTSLPNAYVYTPIKDFSIDDVWTYLLQVDSPWGNDNRDLVAMYKSAQSDECPLVIDKTTPSCGNSRFGCWVCTVVEEDKSMESMIDNGEEWMQPLLEFRNFLKETQKPERKSEFRSHKRRNGRITEKRDGDGVVRGPYYFEVSKKMLRRVLEIQEEIRESGPNPELELIEENELREIRRIWRTERQDWDDSVPKIYEEVTGEELDWVQDDVAGFTAADRELLDELAEDYEVPAGLVAKLLDIERDLHGMSRRASIFNRIDQAFREDWKDEEEVLSELAESRHKPPDQDVDDRIKKTLPVIS